MKNNANMNLAREMVANGVKVLDEKVPGWWRAIDLNSLNMGSCSHCMLGQLFGYNIETAVGAKVFGLPLEKPPNFAFSDEGYFRGMTALNDNPRRIGCNDATLEGAHAGYPDLRCAWAEVIAERRAGGEDSNQSTGKGEAA